MELFVRHRGAPSSAPGNAPFGTGERTALHRGDSDALLSAIYNVALLFPFQRVIRHILRGFRWVSLVVSHRNADIGGAACDETNRVGIIPFVDFIVRLAVHRFVVSAVEE